MCPPFGRFFNEKGCLFGNAAYNILEYADPRFPILPTSIALASSITGNDVVETFEYDYSGTRIKRVIDEDSNPSTDNEVSYFIPFGTENLAELDHRGRIKRAYIFAGSERIGYKGGRNTVLYLKDYLGTTRMTMALYRPSIEEAILQESGDNGPYGRVWNDYAPNETDGEPHQFTGQEREAELGLYYMGARFYDPDLGRFLQVDPAREFWNSYSYVGNNPVMGTDPTGMTVRMEQLRQTDLNSSLDILREMTGWESMTFHENDEGHRTLFVEDYQNFKGGSDEARFVIRTAIESRKTFHLVENNGGGNKNAPVGGENRLEFNILLDFVGLAERRIETHFLSSQDIIGLRKSKGLGPTIIHEIRHRLPLKFWEASYADDPKNKPHGQTGRQVDTANIVRDQMGWPLRTSYRATVDPSSGGQYIFFKFKNGIMRKVWYQNGRRKR